MKNRPHVLIAKSLLALSILVTALPQVSADCPECVTAIVPMPGSGLAPDGSGRRVITVRISQSLANSSGQTLPAVWNAVIGCSGCSPSASEQWNKTTDGAGKTTGYFLKPEQTLSIGSADIIIGLAPPGALPPTTDAGTGTIRDAAGRVIPGKRAIVLSPQALLYSPARLAALIAHEIGHALGLGDDYAKMGCMTIVKQITATYHPSVQPNDVAMVNRHLNNRFECTSPQKQPLPNNPGATPTPTPTSGCIDLDRDGVCVPQDCNDGNPWASSDIDGDGYCEDVDCNDANPLVYPGAFIDPETTGGEDRNCNGVDDYDEQGLGACGSDAEERCRAAGKLWDSTRCTCTFASDPTPVLLDVLGNGFTLTNAATGIWFDIDGDGVKERLAWTEAGADDAWLVLDRNRNGIVDDGRELFGNFSSQPPSSDPNGFRALAVFDTFSEGGNGDRIIDDRDTVYEKLLLWFDFNHNGASEVSELVGLSQVGLKEIHLEFKISKRTDEYGNQFRYRAKVTDVHRAKIGRWAWDVLLVRAP